MTVRLDGQDPAHLDEAARILRAGGLVAFPTETVYGLGARALDPRAVERIFAAKGRPSDNPLILHVATLDDAWPLWDAPPGSASRARAVALADAFWPGPLTLVLPASDLVPEGVRASLPKVAVRVPDHDVARALLARVGEPLAAPSANASGRVSPTTAAHVLATLDDVIDAVVDGGPCRVGLESSVVDVSADPPVLLRPGGLSLDVLRTVLGDLVARAPGQPTHHDASPGLRHRHYAPDIDDITLLDEDALAGRVASDDAILARTSTWARLDARGPRPAGALSARLPDDAAGFARELYGALYHLERACPRALRLERVPDDEEWRAVRDRLARVVTRDGGR